MQLIFSLLDCHKFVDLFFFRSHFFHDRSFCLRFFFLNWSMNRNYYFISFKIISNGFSNKNQMNHIIIYDYYTMRYCVVWALLILNSIDTHIRCIHTSGSVWLTSQFGCWFFSLSISLPWESLNVILFSNRLSSIFIELEKNERMNRSDF